MTTAWQQKCTGNGPCPKGYGLFLGVAKTLRATSHGAALKRTLARASIDRRTRFSSARAPTRPGKRNHRPGAPTSQPIAPRGQAGQIPRDPARSTRRCRPAHESQRREKRCAGAPFPLNRGRADTRRHLGDAPMEPDDIEHDAEPRVPLRSNTWSSRPFLHSNTDMMQNGHGRAVAEPPPEAPAMNRGGNPSRLSPPYYR